MLEGNAGASTGAGNDCVGDKMRIVRTAALLTGVGALVLCGTTSATADPKAGEAFDLTCGSTTYSVVGNGNGEWTPVHDTGSTKTFVPTGFGDFTGTIYDENGVVVDTFTEEGPTVKGSGARDRRGDVISCTFEFDEVSDGSDPEFPAGYRFVGTGEVTGFVPGGR
jgi:hypothetical protein